MKNNDPIVQKIIQLHTNISKKKIYPGNLVNVYIDHIYIQDGNSPTIARLFHKYNFKKVFNPQKISFFFDHSVLSTNNHISMQMKEALIFAKKIKSHIFYRGEGISHIIAIEKKIFLPKKIVLGSDSHTCTGGVFQCLSLGMGASDIIYAMITGKIWIKIPETINIHILGIPHPTTRSKDVILFMLKKYHQQTFLYKSIEISGEWIENLSIDSASTIANMAVELGAKCIFLPYGKNRPNGMYSTTNNNSKYHLDMSIDGLLPQIAKPHYPDNIVSLNKLSGTKIDYVFIGSCANSSLEDIQEISNILKNRKIKKNVHCIITPGSKNIYLKAIKYGYIKKIVKSGAIVTPPGCGPCVGTQGSIPADGDKVLTTMNRNFKGRMGNPNAEIYISSPLVAINTACIGKIPNIEDLQ